MEGQREGDVTGVERQTRVTQAYTDETATMDQIHATSLPVT